MFGQILAMTQLWFRLYVQRIDATRNMARFYEISIEPNLFAGSALVRRWGRIGTRGQERIHLFEDNRQAVSRFLFLVRQKRARGYRTLRRNSDTRERRAPAASMRDTRR